MGKELRVHMDFYLEMKDGESKMDALTRFYKIIKNVEDADIEHESSIQVYETEVQEY